MNSSSLLPLLRRFAPGPVAWEDIIAGYEFGLLQPEEILGWVRGAGCEGPAAQVLLSMPEEDWYMEFCPALWEACREAAGFLPRPGSLLWNRAQDRWRLALLKDCLDNPIGAEALGRIVEAIYETVWCPEDMLSLWRRGSSPRAERGSLEAFVGLLERNLSWTARGAA